MIFKKGQTLFSGTKQKILSFIDRNRSEIAVSWMCECLGVTVSSFHAWEKRSSSTKASRIPNHTVWMQHRVDSKKGKEVYSHRMSVVEPMFDNLGFNKRLNRFSLRGKQGAREMAVDVPRTEHREIGKTWKLLGIARRDR